MPEKIHGKTQDVIHGDGIHAPVIGRAVRFHAGTARYGHADDVAEMASGRSGGVVRGTEDGNLRNMQGRRHMHQAGVVCDKEAALVNQRNGLS